MTSFYQNLISIEIQLNLSLIKKLPGESFGDFNIEKVNQMLLVKKIAWCSPVTANVTKFLGWIFYDFLGDHTDPDEIIAQFPFTSLSLSGCAAKSQWMQIYWIERLNDFHLHNARNESHRNPPRGYNVRARVLRPNKFFITTKASLKKMFDNFHIVHKHFIIFE